MRQVDDILHSICRPVSVSIMAPGEETLDSLASKIAVHTKSITSYLDSNGLPAPSFAGNGVAEYPAVPEVQGARMSLIESLMDMLHLAMGGGEYIFTQSMVVCHTLSPVTRHQAVITRLRAA